MYQQALVIRKNKFREKHNSYVTSLGNLATIYIIHAKYKEAEKLYKRALEIKKELSEEKYLSYASLLNKLGILYYSQGKYIEAKPLYEEALIIFKDSLGEKSLDYAQLMNNLALLYIQQEKYIDAEDLLQKVLEIKNKELGEKHSSYANSLNNLALLYVHQDMYSKAEPLYQKALIIIEESLGKGHPEYAQFLKNLAGLYSSQAKYNKAENLYQQAIEIRRNKFGENHPEYTKALGDLAVLYCYQGRYYEADLLYQQVLKNYEYFLGKKHIYYADLIHNLTGLYYTLGRRDETEVLCKEALIIKKELLGEQHTSYANSLSNLAKIYENKKNYVLAESFHQQVLSIKKEVLGYKHSEYGQSLGNLAFLYYLQGIFDKSEFFYKKALVVNRDIFGEKHPEYARILNNLAKLYISQRQYEKSDSLYKQSLNIFEESFGKYHIDHATLTGNLAELYEYQDKYTQAEPLYKEGSQALIAQTEKNFANLSEKEKGQFLATFKDNFDNYQSFAFKATNPALAGWLYDNTLALKGILLQSSQKMRSRIMNGNNEALKKLFGEWQDQRSYLAKLYSIGKASIEKQGIDLVKEEAKANDLEKQLSLKSELFAEEIDKNKKRVVWQDVQKQLKAGEVAIEINRFQLFDKEWTDKTMYTVLILSPQKAQPEMLFLENGNWIEKEALDIYQKYYQSDNAEGKDAELYNRLWLPIMKALPAGTRKVFVSADGAYHQINLQTLFNPTSQKYAVEEMEIVMVSTTKELLVRPKPTLALPASCVLVGNPDYTLNLNNGKVIDKRSFNDLVSTQNEVETIAKFTTSRHIKTQVYVGKEASEDVIKSLQSPSILHISTHGTYQDGTVKKRSGNPLRKDIPSMTSQMGDLAHDFSPPVDNPLLKSMLFFTGAEWAWQERLEANLTGEDGLLKAYEAMNLNLDDTDLVVLSACETSLGKINAGEGVYGLRRAFQQAGANAVIASLWKVREDATQDFMVLFYENWLTHNMSKRKAFDEAQKAIKAQEKYKKPYFWGAFVMIGE